MRKLIISLLFMLSANAFLSAQTRVFDEKIFSDKDSRWIPTRVCHHASRKSSSRISITERTHYGLMLWRSMVKGAL